ncbi:MAG TPA: hypothetical protein VNO14_16325 [Blastocatellia bacterium]|nr:hypothetical protein [Blastocatellia bacterium]
MMTKLLLLSMILAVPVPVTGAPVVFSATGSDPASIQSTVEAFRAVLGTPNNGNAPGPLAGGRREINWDGGGSTATSLAGTPFAGFQATRGALFTTPGTGFVQAPVDGIATTFSNLSYSTIFQPFSPVRLFSPTGSNITDATFFIPGGANIPATVNGFGAVFTDVDLPMSTSIELFDPQGMSLGVFFAPPANNGLSFIGVVFNAGERVSRVRITSGNVAAGPMANDDGTTTDIVVMDDFLYGEPMALMGGGGGGAGGAGAFSCLQDDSSGSVLLIDTATGAFQFSSCTGVVFTGTGTVRTRGCAITLSANLPTGRATARVDTCVGKGSAGIQIFSQGGTFTITDRDTTNNTCACP